MTEHKHSNDYNIHSHKHNIYRGSYNNGIIMKMIALMLSFIIVISGVTMPQSSMTAHAITPVVKQVTLSVSKITKPKEGWSADFTSAGSFAFAKDADVSGETPIHTIGYSSYVESPDKWKAVVSASTSTTKPTLTAPMYATGGKTYSIEATFRTSIAYDQISGIIYNSSANNVIAYGKIGNVESGSHSFTMPADIAKGSYTLWVFLEKFNEGKADQIYTIGKKSFTIKDSGTVEKHDVTIDFSYPIKLESGDTTQLNLTGQMSPVIVTLASTQGYYFPQDYMAGKSPVDGVIIEYLAPSRIRIYGTPERRNTYVNLDPPSARESAKYSVRIDNLEDAAEKGHMSWDSTSNPTEQTDITGMMKTIVFKAEDGYYFDTTDFVMRSYNGVNVTKFAVDTIRISGVPTADTVLTMLTDIPAAKKKTTPEAPDNVTAGVLKLIGTTRSMEYAYADNPDRWLSCTGGETAVSAGKVYVRYKATDISYSGKVLELNVPGGQITTNNSDSNDTSTGGGSSSIGGSASDSSSPFGGSSTSSGGSTSGSGSTSNGESSSSSGSASSGGSTSGNSSASSGGPASGSVSASGGGSVSGGGSASNGGSSSSSGSAGSVNNSRENSSNNNQSNINQDGNISTKSPDTDNTYNNQDSNAKIPVPIDNSKDDKPDKNGYTVTVNNPTGTHITIWTETENNYHQTNVTDRIKNVSYYANVGYCFPANYNIPSVNGINVIRNGAKKITVCGAPTADTVITLLPASLITNNAPYIESDTISNNTSENKNTYQNNEDIASSSQSNHSAISNTSDNGSFYHSTNNSNTLSPTQDFAGNSETYSIDKDSVSNTNYTDNKTSTTTKSISDKTTNAAVIKKLKPLRKKFTIKKGRSIKLKINIIMNNSKKILSTKAGSPVLIYKSSNKKIATINSKGKIKGIRKGKCTIYISAKNGVSTKVKIKVKNCSVKH